MICLPHITAEVTRRSDRLLGVSHLLGSSADLWKVRKVGPDRLLTAHCQPLGLRKEEGTCTSDCTVQCFAFSWNSNRFSSNLSESAQAKELLCWTVHSHWVSVDPVNEWTPSPATIPFGGNYLKHSSRCHLDGSKAPCWGLLRATMCLFCDSYV